MCVGGGGGGAAGRTARPRGLRWVPDPRTSSDLPPSSLAHQSIEPGHDISCDQLLVDLVDLGDPRSSWNVRASNKCVMSEQSMSPFTSWPGRGGLAVGGRSRPRTGSLVPSLEDHPLLEQLREGGRAELTRSVRPKQGCSEAERPAAGGSPLPPFPCPVGSLPLEYLGKENF